MIRSACYSQCKLRVLGRSISITREIGAGGEADLLRGALSKKSIGRWSRGLKTAYEQRLTMGRNVGQWDKVGHEANRAPAQRGGLLASCLLGNASSPARRLPLRAGRPQLGVRSRACYG